MGKHIKLEQVKNTLAPFKTQNKSIVSTNGCFDLIHPGHIDYLKKAKALGDILIVGLNSDQSVSRLKGPNRPITSELSRATILEHLTMVDFVCIFQEPTPLTFLNQVAPSIHVKGGDYHPENLPETPLVEQLGGRIQIIPFLSGYSSSTIIQKIKNT